MQLWGGWLGWLAYAASASYRRRLNENARAAGVPKAERRRAVAEAGRMVAELPWLWLRPADRPLGERVQWVDPAPLDAAVADGRGVLLLTPHLGCFEVCAQAIAERHGARMPLTAMYRPARQAWLAELQLTARQRPGMVTVPASLAGVRQMIRALRRGEAVGLLPDQVPPEGMGVWAPWFGRPAYTMTLAARLARQTGCAVRLIWAERLPQGRGWRLRVEPMAEAWAAGAPDDEATQLADAALLNREMARLIGQCPGQYLWGYHRHKTPRGPDRPAAAAPEAGG